jgi:ribonuclease HII
MDKSEFDRLEKMYVYERERFNEGRSLIAGVDEVGRGSIAGPVVACAVILPKDCFIEYTDDSKKLSAEKRKAVSKIIRENALDIAFGVVMSAEIDKINILNATHKAMRMAIDSLGVKPDAVLVDGNRVPELCDDQQSIIKGDRKSLSIASASIVAKVFRDSLMYAYDKMFPGYGFSQNKGYGTKDHMEALKTLGLCSIHRRTFIRDANIAASEN